MNCLSSVSLIIGMFLISGPQKKLCFGQQTGKKSKTTTAARSDHTARVRSSANHKQNLVKPKNEKRLEQPEADHKGPHLSHATPRFTTGCTSIEICSQSAIAFSQRQMQDFECLATKLTNELKTMKEIAESRLFSEGSTSLKFKTSEVWLHITTIQTCRRISFTFHEFTIVRVILNWLFRPFYQNAIELELQT